MKVRPSSQRWWVKDSPGRTSRPQEQKCRIITARVVIYKQKKDTLGHTEFVGGLQD